MINIEVNIENYIVDIEIPLLYNTNRRKSHGTSSISGLKGSSPVGFGREHNSLLKFDET